jgi:tetratricopeptide (TPR) repeat protein
MSSTKSESEGGEEEVCASCGIAAVDDVKMKACSGGCDLVKYCSDNCQENNRDHHEQECKERKAELRDKQLFEQPGSSYYLGECPICFLPLSLDITKSRLMPCCSQFICIGCDYANLKREYEGGLQHRCSFCREPIPRSQKEADRYSKKRGKKNCPVALNHMAKERFSKGDNGKGLEYLTKAADLGYANAHMCLATLYEYGANGVEKDKTKFLYHYEEAAIGGEPNARFHLAKIEEKNGRFERAAKHYIIAANLGYDLALQGVKDLFVKGIVRREDYAAALRACQTAVDETKSAERKIAEEGTKNGYFLNNVNVSAG